MLPYELLNIEEVITNASITFALGQILKKGVENTIINIGRLGRDGMRETDKEIIRIMIGDT